MNKIKKWIGNLFEKDDNTIIFNATKLKKPEMSLITTNYNTLDLLNAGLVSSITGIDEELYKAIDTIRIRGRYDLIIELAKKVKEAYKWNNRTLQWEEK